MMNGAFAKRFWYFMSSLFRFISSIGLLIALIVVLITVKPAIDWLNGLLIGLCISTLVTAVFNLIMCSIPATGYRTNFALQLVCFLVTMFTGGLFSTVFTGIAVFTKEQDDEVENEKIINSKTFKGGEKKDEK